MADTSGMTVADHAASVATNEPDKRGAILEHLLRIGIDGTGPLKSAREAAEEALKQSKTEEAAIRALIRTHVAMAGAQGFLTNLGGFVSLPVTLPANVGMAYIIQTRLAASIAHVRGHDLDSDQVRTAILLCLLGNAATEVFKKMGVEVGKKLTLNAIKRLNIEIIRAVNKRLGFMLITKYGTKRGTIVLAKGVPIVGGLVGGGVDTATTLAVGRFADHFFEQAQDDAVAA
jgi:hypothetical protein